MPRSDTIRGRWEWEGWCLELKTPVKVKTGKAMQVRGDHGPHQGAGEHYAGGVDPQGA